MAKVLGLKQLLQKKYTYLDRLSKEFIESFGKLTDTFAMIVYGVSGQGKSNMMLKFIRELTNYGIVLIVSFEEGHEETMQSKVCEHLSLELHNGKVKFADNDMHYEELVKLLLKKKSPKFIVIDSLQYFGITYEQYKFLKERFKKKSFIYISHSKGRHPEGSVGFKIRHDVGLKVRVEGYIAFVISRYGGNKNYVIWEQGAKNYWKKNYKKLLNR